MATIQIKRSELRRLIQEGVKPIAEAWAEKHKKVDEESKNTIREMVKDALEEAFGESGDHNGAHVGGTFGDGETKEGPISEAKKDKGASKKPTKGTPKVEPKKTPNKPKSK
jgi:hypothetical protein